MANNVHIYFSETSEIDAVYLHTANQPTVKLDLKNSTIVTIESSPSASSGNLQLEGADCPMQMNLEF